VCAEAYEKEMHNGGQNLAFARYCHCQYCMVYIAITEGRGEILYCAIVWAMTGRGGVPKQRVGAQRIVLIRAQRPIHKTILYRPSQGSSYNPRVRVNPG